TQHLFHETLANEIDAEHAAPVLMLQGTAENADGQSVAQVSVVGITDDFWYEYEKPKLPKSDDVTMIHGSMHQEPTAILSKKLADDLRLQPGATIAVHIPSLSLIPRESSLGQR